MGKEQSGPYHGHGLHAWRDNVSERFMDKILTGELVECIGK